MSTKIHDKDEFGGQSQATALGQPANSFGASGSRPGIAAPVLVGLVTVLLFFGIFGAWAAIAPLESAAIAPGEVIFDGKRKTIQHLEGGIVGEILTRDGDEVKAGDVLVRLDDERSRADLALLRARYMVATALAARLEAERDGLDQIEYPKSLLERSRGGKVVEILRVQTNIFDARRESVSNQVAILEQRIAQHKEEIGGLHGEIKAENKQLELIAEEINDLQTLVEKGLARKPRLLEMRRLAADIEGERSSNVAGIARAKQSISEARMRILDLYSSMMSEVVQELRDVQAEQFDLIERLRVAEDVIRRTEVRAPLDGTIVNLQIHSPRGVIGPGEPLLDIVPRNDRLVVEAKVSPADIDVVHQGLPAQVRLTAFNSRNVTPVDGVVSSVSADRLIEERSGEAYYVARVELTGNVADALDGAELYPGMPAEVMIVTGARTAVDYAIRPITRSLERAFREE